MVEPFFKGLVRGIGYIIGEILFATIFYWTGWLFYRVITFGKYPPKEDRMSFTQDTHSHGFVSFTGLMLWIASVIYLTGTSNNCFLRQNIHHKLLILLSQALGKMYF